MALLERKNSDRQKQKNPLNIIHTVFHGVLFFQQLTINPHCVRLETKAEYRASGVLTEPCQRA